MRRVLIPNVWGSMRAALASRPRASIQAKAGQAKAGLKSKAFSPTFRIDSPRFGANAQGRSPVSAPRWLMQSSSEYRFHCSCRRCRIAEPTILSVHGWFDFDGQRHQAVMAHPAAPRASRYPRTQAQNKPRWFGPKRNASGHQAGHTGRSSPARRLLRLQRSPGTAAARTTVS